MKLLLDESIPYPLISSFPPAFQVRTVRHMGWAGGNNGDLLRLAAEHGFDALVTADQGIEYQQNLNNLPLPIVIMVAHRTRVQELRPLVSQVVAIANGDLRRIVYRVAD